MARAMFYDSYQDEVRDWMLQTFPPEVCQDRVERADRLLEEVFELLQSGGYDPARVAMIRDYVWGRPVGEPAQEVGGVAVTLAAYCWVHGLDYEAAARAEVARVWTMIDVIRRKQAAKPKGSPLPVAVDHPAEAPVSRTAVMIFGQPKLYYEVYECDPRDGAMWTDERVTSWFRGEPLP